MENIVNQLSKIEAQALSNINLLEIAKDYCKFNMGKCSEISTLETLLDVILTVQRELTDNLDGIA